MRCCAAGDVWPFKGLESTMTIRGRFPTPPGEETVWGVVGLLLEGKA